MNPITKPTVTVIGAGFSGLVTAYYLVKAGARVVILEGRDRAGGLINTRETEYGLVETAANGILNSAALESICHEIGVKLVSPLPASRARYIWRDYPRRWPLSLTDALGLGAGLLRNLGKWGPVAEESISVWGARVLGRGATIHALAPALNGIYAGDPDCLSASLILGRHSPNGEARPKSKEKPRIRGTVAPLNGMRQLIDGLSDYLTRNGAELIFNQPAELQSGRPAIICTSVSQAAELLRGPAPEVSAALGRIKMLSLVSATSFYQRSPEQPHGFGCLFPRESGFRARGVLFNDCIFEGRSDYRSETWIFGGALDQDVVGLSDQELHAVISADHARLTGRQETALAGYITRWPQALPHYTIDLERSLATLPSLPKGIALSGNYLGGIGLAKILARARQVATKVIEG